MATPEEHDRPADEALEAEKQAKGVHELTDDELKQIAGGSMMVPQLGN